jgi:hypothetical protein
MELQNRIELWNSMKLQMEIEVKLQNKMKEIII